MIPGFRQAQNEYEEKMFNPFEYMNEEDDEDDEDVVPGEPDYYKEYIENLEE